MRLRSDAVGWLTLGGSAITASEWELMPCAGTVYNANVISLPRAALSHGGGTDAQSHRDDHAVAATIGRTAALPRSLGQVCRRHRRIPRAAGTRRELAERRRGLASELSGRFEDRPVALPIEAARRQHPCRSAPHQLRRRCQRAESGRRCRSARCRSLQEEYSLRCGEGAERM